MFTDFKQKLMALTPNEMVLLLLTASIFLTVYVEVAALILLPIYIGITKQGFIFLRRKQDLCFLSAFWILSIAVTVWAGGTAFDLLLGVFMIFAFIAMIFITYTMTQRMFRIILSFVCFMSPYCFIVALIQRALGLEWAYGARYSSVFTNPNYYAFYISLVVLFCIYNIVKSESERLRGVYAALIPINLLALHLTECRTTYIVLLIICPIMLFSCGKKKWAAVYMVLLLGFTALILLFGDSVRFLPRVEEITKDFSKRLSIWSGAIGSILDAPVFGRGYNTYARIHEQYGSYSIAKHSHNLLLELLMDFGFAGTAVLLGYFSINVGKIIRLHRQNKCHQRYALTVSVIVCVLLHGLLDITMLWPQTSLLIMYVVGFSTEYDKEHIFGTSRRHEILSVRAKQLRTARTNEPIL